MSCVARTFGSSVSLCTVGLALFVPVGANAGAMHLESGPLAHADSRYKETVLYSFQGGSDGVAPLASLIADKVGNHYGTTYLGGGSGCGGTGCGTVFRLASDGSETVLHSFGGGTDGEYPQAALLTDKAGDLFGTTPIGGTYGAGTVFEITSNGTESVLFSFTGNADGANPVCALVADGSGNLYGTTLDGGKYGDGAVFELAADGTQSVLHAFAGGSDGANPGAGLIPDEAGNLYGTTESGGSSNQGTIFKVATDGTETVLYAFPAGAKSGYGVPLESLVADAAGNLYTPVQGDEVHPYGGIFKLAQDGKGTILHWFKSLKDGTYPFAALIVDAKGDLYGTTASGGRKGCGGGYACGTVFKLAPGGAETVLHSFAAGSDGESPEAGLIADKRGNLFGTTSEGGTDGNGTVFKLTK